jgi:redox-sensing transcriptional repressor
MENLNKATIQRLLLYYHYISDHLAHTDGVSVSSAEIARLIDVDDTQVRKDLSALGLKGCPRVGFKMAEVKQTIRIRLGFNDCHKAIVVGAGKLGGAIGSYKEFFDYGLNVIALFDNDPNKIGLMIGDHVVQPVDKVETFIRDHDVQMGILAVPADTAQDVARKVIQAGLKALWVFSSTHIEVPENIAVRHEHLLGGLAEMLYSMKMQTIKQSV